MSTASRDCGMAGGSCGGGRHAPATPGVRAWPRGYYDPRAAWQLGSPQGVAEVFSDLAKKSCRFAGAVQRHSPALKSWHTRAGQRPRLPPRNSAWLEFRAEESVRDSNVTLAKDDACLKPRIPRTSRMPVQAGSPLL